MRMRYTPFIGPGLFERSAIVLVVFLLLVGCERSISERCATAPSEACCLLSRAEAESRLNGVAELARSQSYPGYSLCSYETEEGGGAELVYFPGGGEPETFASATRDALAAEKSILASSLKIPGYSGRCWWVPGAAFPDGRQGVLFVADGDEFFRIAATPLGDGWPAWKRPRDLARVVLRNLAARDREG